MPAPYDDPVFSYSRYWQGRDYEHISEVIALEFLLAGRHFDSLADIGGGYGRLVPTLIQYASHVTLIEPSPKQRSLAQKHLASEPRVTVTSGTAQKTGLPAASQDAVTLIRVLHHLPDFAPAIREAARILHPGGWLVLEFANSANIKARLTSFLSGHPIPDLPVEKRSRKNIRAHSIPFVNHHPQTVLASLRSHGFIPQQTLSVSNLRHPLIKKIFPLKFLLILESALQSLLSHLYFGPSIFILARRVDNPSTP